MNRETRTRDGTAAATRSATTIDCDTLVHRAMDPRDENAWREIDARYRSLVVGLGRSTGLSAAEADEAAQMAMADFALALRAGRFDRSKARIPGQRGRLRDYLFGIARKKIADVLADGYRGPVLVAGAMGRTTFFSSQPADAELEERWDAEWNTAVAARCLEEAQAHFSTASYRMFCLRVLEERPSKEVAALEGTTPQAVDMACHHVRTFLRQIRMEIEAAF